LTVFLFIRVNWELILALPVAEKLRAKNDPGKISVTEGERV
jgi:hypothetical protein